MWAVMVRVSFLEKIRIGMDPEFYFKNDLFRNEQKEVGKGEAVCGARTRFVTNEFL